MRKFLIFATMLVVGFTSAFADCQDGPYGLRINGTKVVDAPKFGDPDAQGRVQYKASCVELAVGDEIQLINTSCDATWMVDLDPYGSYESFTGGKTANKLTCNVAGSYDFYIKLSSSAGDLIYVGPGENCSGGGGTGGGGNGDCKDGPYGLQINGTTVVDAPQFGDPDAQGRTQYKAACVELAAGDEIQLINKSCNATWMVDLDPYGSYESFTGGKTANKLTCNTAGKYDFYIKLSATEGDLVYVGPGDCSGGGGGGGGDLGGHTVDGFFLIGNWNGMDHGDGDDYANFIPENEFINCKISKTFEDTNSERSFCWIRAKAKLDGGTGWMFFSTDGWQGDGNQTITLYSAKYLSEIGHDGNSERWSVPTNKKLNITLKVISVNEVQLTLVDDAAYASWTCNDAGIGNLTEVEEVEKDINAGLDLNAPMFDVLGRKVGADYRGIIIQNGKKFIR